jgi:hypothetical protein
MNISPLIPVARDFNNLHAVKLFLVSSHVPSALAEQNIDKHLSPTISFEPGHP